MVWQTKRPAIVLESAHLRIAREERLGSLAVKACLGLALHVFQLLLFVVVVSIIQDRG